MRICHTLWNAIWQAKNLTLFCYGHQVNWWTLVHCLWSRVLFFCFLHKMEQDQCRHRGLYPCVYILYYIFLPKQLWKEERGCCQKKLCSFIPKVILVGPTGIVQERCRSNEWVCVDNLLSVAVCVGLPPALSYHWLLLADCAALSLLGVGLMTPDWECGPDYAL